MTCCHFPDRCEWPDRKRCRQRGGLSCFFRDIEERKRNDDRLQQLTEGLNFSQMMVRSLDGTIQFWSAGCARLCGFTEEEAIGRRSHELLQTEFTVPLEDIQAALLSTGTWHRELRHTCRNGRLVITASDWILHRGPEGDVRAVIQSNSDITEQKRSLERLHRANQELTQFSNIVSQ